MQLVGCMNNETSLAYEECAVRMSRRMAQLSHESDKIGRRQLQVAFPAGLIVWTFGLAVSCYTILAWEDH
jgi:hypothetical protein